MQAFTPIQYTNTILTLEYKQIEYSNLILLLTRIKL